MSPFSLKLKINRLPKRSPERKQAIHQLVKLLVPLHGPDIPIPKEIQ